MPSCARKTSPFVDIPRAIARDAHWVEPKLVAQIAFTERTSDGLLRHPAFLGLRGDKPAKDVQTQAVITMAKKPTTSAGTDDIAGVKISHPERVLFAESGITKLDLAEYFLAVSEPMLPYCKARPLSLVRCPEGPAKQCFFQKHTKKGMPSALKSVPVTESDGETADYLMVDNASGLVAVAQIGGIEIHLWGARAKTLERPDRLVFDLDPDPSVDFAGVREAARDVSKLLETAGLETLPARHRRQGHPRRRPARRQPGLGDDQERSPRASRRSSPSTSPSASSPPCRRPSARAASSSTGCATSAARRPSRPIRRAPRPRAASPCRCRGRSCRASIAPTSSRFPSCCKRIKRKTDPWSGYFETRQKISKAALRFFM